MRAISIRHKIAAQMEVSQSGIGVSKGVRDFMRKNDPKAAGLRNPELNELIAADFARGTPVHRIRLTNGERKGIGEFRHSGSYFYLAFVRGRGTHNVGYDILAVQRSYKRPKFTPDLEKRRLEPGWGFEY